MKPLSSLATAGKPFFFITDFLAQKIEAYPLEDLALNNIYFDFNASSKINKHHHQLDIVKPSFKAYQKGFDSIIEAIKRGETYVLNYTQKTAVKTPLSLKEIYDSANARYKLYFKDKFVCFSPETFITIEDNTIHTFPMKGTIDAKLPDALKIILDDKKELAEHIMIVDLLRNDLSQVASEVTVTDFRYAETIKAGDKELIQISSHIQGKLTDNWKEKLDDIISMLLPAGSISGAPKKSTVEHILKIENYDRDYFCGVMGYFDGKKLTTAVMIRFIEKEENKLFYKSGGGITIDSDAQKEFQELLDKIYIP